MFSSRVQKTLLFLFLLITISCQKKELFKNSNVVDFEKLMGVDTKYWQHIQQSEDWQNLRKFRDLFVDNYQNSSPNFTERKIPKVLHIIWLGPRDFPHQSQKNLATWQENNPDWKIKFWSDRPRKIALSNISYEEVHASCFDDLYDCYLRSQNYGEKSDVLRYEILYREGGVYSDHDVECMQSFAAIIDNYDFFCGIEPPHAPIVNGAVTACNNLIGVVPNHPILKQCIDTVRFQWNEWEVLYGGKDRESTIYRVAHRTFAPFDAAVKQLAGKSGFRDIVFPAGFFNRLENKYGLFAHHYYQTSWFEEEKTFEKKMRRRMEYIAKKSHRIYLLVWTLLGLNALIIGYLIFLHRKKTGV